MVRRVTAASPSAMAPTASSAGQGLTPPGPGTGMGSDRRPSAARPFRGRFSWVSRRSTRPSAQARRASKSASPPSATSQSSSCWPTPASRFARTAGCSEGSRLMRSRARSTRSMPHPRRRVRPATNIHSPLDRDRWRWSRFRSRAFIASADPGGRSRIAARAPSPPARRPSTVRTGCCPPAGRGDGSRAGPGPPADRTP